MPSSRTPKAGEVWLTNCDPQVGREQAGRRPALILSHDRFNAARNGLVFLAPMTGTDRGLPIHYRIEAGVGGLSKTSYVLCDQAKSTSELRLLQYMGEVPAEVLLEVRRITGRFIDADKVYRQGQSR